MRNATMNPIIVAVLAICTAVAASVQAATPNFQIASGGRARAVIVAEPGTNGYAYAANELAKYLGKITGATFMVADRPGKGFNTIQVGASYKACCALIKLLPARTACWVIGKLYAA